HAKTGVIAEALFIRIQNGIDNGVGALRGFGGIGQGFLAAVIDAIGKNDQCLAALLLAHEFVGCEEDRVVKVRAAASPPATAAAVPSTAARVAAASSAWATAASSARARLRCVQGLQRRLKLGPRIGEVLQKGHIKVEVDDE